MASFVQYQSRSNGRSCHVRESRAEGERRQARDDDTKPRIRPGRVVQGFCRNPLLYGLKGGEKSPVGNLAGPAQLFAPGGFAALLAGPELQSCRSRKSTLCLKTLGGITTLQMAKDSN
jgi:hypothetical protein